MEFFTMNAPDSLPWTLYSWVRGFHTIWVHLGPFRRLTKLGSLWAELVQLIQKFMPQSRVRIFGDERTRSTPLDSKLMVWQILYCLIVFGTVLLRYETQFKTGRPGAINAKVHATNVASDFFTMNIPDPPHWTSNSWFSAFRIV